MQDTERKLTKAELERKPVFDRTVTSYAEKGYRMERIVMGIVEANVLALVLAAPFIVVFGIIFFVLHPGALTGFNFGSTILILVAFLVLIVIHELIHGLVWGAFVRNRWKSVSFGFIVQYLTPYCTCNEPLPRGAYIFGALAPTLVLGVLPILVSFATGSFLLFVIGALLILGGGGDMAIILKMLRFRSEATETVYLDHPYEIGLVAFER